MSKAKSFSAKRRDGSPEKQKGGKRYGAKSMVVTVGGSVLSRATLWKRGLKENAEYARLLQEGQSLRDFGKLTVFAGGGGPDSRRFRVGGGVRGAGAGDLGPLSLENSPDQMLGTLGRGKKGLSYLKQSKKGKVSQRKSQCLPKGCRGAGRGIFGRVLRRFNERLPAARGLEKGPPRSGTLF